MTERFQFQLLSFFILLATVLGQNEEHRNLQVGLRATLCCLASFSATVDLTIYKKN